MTNQLTDRPSNQLTDGRTDERTKRGVESRSTRQEIKTAEDTTLPQSIPTPWQFAD